MGRSVIDDQLSALLDDCDFHEVQSRMSRFNLFEALGAVHGELKHSNFLGYLLAPNRPHGLGSRPLKRILRSALETIPSEARPISILDLIVGDLDNAIVHRERYAIDLLIEIEEVNLIVVIENKVRAKAGDGQLARYRERVTAEYPGYRKLYLFLTPTGAAPDDDSYWPLSYSALAQTLDVMAAEPSTGDDARLILEHYVDMLRKNIVDDDHLRSLAAKLYERHREALDFIFESRPQIANLVEFIAHRVRSMDGLIIDTDGPSMLRFLPTQWEGTLTHKSDLKDWSRTGRGLLFELKRDSARPGRLMLSLVMGPGEATDRAALYEGAKSRPDLFVGLVKPMGVKWCTIFSRDLITAKLAESLTTEQQEANAELAWSDFQGTTLPALIHAVLEIEQEIAASKKATNSQSNSS